ncbi:Oxidoreductase [Alloactinosynnema sp. L-07]|uniref:FAD-dependent monooxygenase n=1 Tax=Alloactinosynnema sp. L-07 TaxID=1653480 RepID=UPI00065EF650|nr:FAD-dependent monooxygenase [Alloactinosynnema sp. L-07]CRK56336.1 Oxidoreductase [Alloactinosynnema sp. L-07]
MRVLISGASIAGPVLAYWLAEYGYDVTVVERAPALRKTGGHAIDLFRPSMEISERMGLIDRIQAKATGTNRMTVWREGVSRPVAVDLSKLYAATSDRHVEIMRDDLSEIYYDASRDRAEYVFGDMITSIAPDGGVTFTNGADRRFDLVIGADGLHSGVRELVFGEESKLSTFIGAYLAVASVPKDLAPGSNAYSHMGVGRMALLYSADHIDDARAVFTFRPGRRLDYHYRDTARQRELLLEHCTGMHPDVDGWLREVERSETFYFDSISQIKMDTWSRGRVTLVGDAGYCPGPAVGGSTSLAVVGAYVLAGELAAADGDHERAFPAYERAMHDLVERSRAFALGVAKTLIPSSRLGLWALVHGGRLVSALPSRVSQAVAKLNEKGIRMHDSMTVRDYALTN